MNKTVINKMNKTVKSIIIAIACIIALGAGMIEIVPSGYTGVLTTFGQVNDKNIDAGLTIVLPYIQNIKNVNNKQQEIRVDDKIWGETRADEKIPVYATGITITYRINPEYSSWIYKNVSDYKELAVSNSLVSSAIKDAMVNFTAAEVTVRNKIEPASIRTLQEALNERYNGNEVIKVISVNIDNMDFEDSYNKAINDRNIARMNAEEQAVTYKNQITKAESEAEINRINSQAEADKALIEAQAEADRMKIAAEAEANRIKIEAEAKANSIITIAEAEAKANKLLSDSLSEMLLRHETIEKWSGNNSSIIMGTNADSGINVVVPFSGLE